MSVTRKQINTNSPSVACDVCGRSLLRGEHAALFLFQGSRRSVCDLCTVRAAHDGWIREGVDDVLIPTDDRPRRSALRGLMRPRRGDQDLEPGGAESLLAGVPAGPAPQPAGDPPPARRSPDLRPEPVRPQDVVEPPHPDELLYDDRSVRGIPSNVELKVARSLELFNGSAHIRTVSGVSRTLGTPMVCARPSLTEGSVVSIVVAWELSWYRFEVDLGDEASGVRVVGQGAELSELEQGDLEPNGTATADGRLQYVAPALGVEP